MNRRSPELDRYLGELVIVRFSDNDLKVGVLEYGVPIAEGLPDRQQYSIWEFGKGRTYFRKTHVKGLSPWKDTTENNKAMEI